MFKVVYIVEEFTLGKPDIGYGEGWEVIHKCDSLVEAEHYSDNCIEKGMKTKVMQSFMNVGKEPK